MIVAMFAMQNDSKNGSKPSKPANSKRPRPQPEGKVNPPQNNNSSDKEERYVCGLCKLVFDDKDEDEATFWIGKEGQGKVHSHCAFVCILFCVLSLCLNFSPLLLVSHPSGCDNCYKWYHGRCVSETQKSAEQHDRYICPLCKKKEKTKSSS